MKKKVDVSKNAREFLKRFDALTDTTADCERAELEEELRACGVDPDRARSVAYDRLRKLATHHYTSLGKDVPAQMSQALRQLRPPSPEEVEKKKKSAASSKVKEFLSNIRSGAGAILQTGTLNQSFAPAFRMKAGEVSKEDEDILSAQQADLDAQEPGDER